MDAATRLRLRRAVDATRREHLHRSGQFYACDAHDAFVRHCAGCGQKRRRLLEAEQRERVG